MYPDPADYPPARKNMMSLSIALKHGMGSMPLYSLLVEQRVQAT